MKGQESQLMDGKERIDRGKPTKLKVKLWDNQQRDKTWADELGKDWHWEELALGLFSCGLCATNFLKRAAKTKIIYFVFRLKKSHCICVSLFVHLSIDRILGVFFLLLATRKWVSVCFLQKNVISVGVVIYVYITLNMLSQVPYAHFLKSFQS